MRERVESTIAEFDPIAYKHALENAAADLRRVTRSLVSRFPSGMPAARLLTWADLLDVEEQAFSDLGFQSRNEQSVIDGLARIRPSFLATGNFARPVDWMHDIPSLPVVYQCVREVLAATQVAVDREHV
ncbi:DUF2471 family protein [Burkholderia alba]|uniref:DUF2471 family protein n=1 Tax=Burkholderia alba TaxID=2683677 RepID=UPI002B05DCCB|nr:DUF2471 family protein [Burkholderia alba]